MVDSEAQTKVWTDLALTPVQLAGQLTDDQLRKFLPVLFPGLRLLMIHADGSEMKTAMADLMTRVAALFQFSFEADASVAEP
jgi:hypothetical protein